MFSVCLCVPVCAGQGCTPADGRTAVFVLTVCGSLGTSGELRVTEVCVRVGTRGWLGVRVSVGQRLTNTAL